VVPGSLTIGVSGARVARLVPAAQQSDAAHWRTRGLGDQVRRIIYCSRATEDMSPDELVELLKLSRRNNAAAGLSGMLLYSSMSFLQVLDGDPAALEATYARIDADPRHCELRLLSDTEVAAPLFPAWTMGFDHVDDDDLSEELDAFTPAITYPLVNPNLITNAGVAQTLLTLYAKNAAG